jgi:hypothetical protein
MLDTVMFLVEEEKADESQIPTLNKDRLLMSFASVDHYRVRETHVKFKCGPVSAAAVLRMVVIAEGVEREEDMIVWWSAIVEFVWCCEIRWVVIESYRNEVHMSDRFTEGPKPE